MPRKKKDRNRSKRLIVLFTAIIMISSVFGVMFYGFGDPGQDTTYQGVQIYQEQGNWVMNVEGNPVFFDYHPSEVYSVVIPEDLVGSLQGIPELDVTFEQNSSFVSDVPEIIESMRLSYANALSVFIREGITEKADGSKPVITCEDATAAVPVISVHESDEFSIEKDGSCIVVFARNSVDVRQAKDRILYGMLGVIEV